MITITAANEKPINIGSASFLHCFYSTICAYVLKAEAPNAIGFLNNRIIDSSVCKEAAREFNLIRDKLSQHMPSEVVWDIAEPKATPPWGDNISSVVTSLGNYFTTADGFDLISELVLLLYCAGDNNTNVIIE